MFNYKNKLLSSLLLIGAISMISQDIFAQSESDSRLEEVVVTAQKREQGLAEVPISIQVLSGEKIQDLGITSMESLSNYVPGLMINKGAAQFNIYMRGVGSGTNKGFSQSVTQFIDGMAINRGEQYLAPMLDLERVEVLKGSQGVLFGKNTIGGVINMVSRSPEVGGERDITWSIESVPEWNTTKLEYGHSIPVSDSFAMRIAASHEDSDGWTYNALLDEDGPTTNSTAVRATFLLQLDNVEVNLKVFNSTLERFGQHGATDSYRTPVPLPQMLGLGFQAPFIAGQIVNRHYSDQIVGQPGITYLDNTSAGLPTGGTVDSDNIILNISTTVGDFNVKSTTSISEYDYAWGLDADFGPMKFLSTDNFNQYESFTQEFIITSPSDDTFEYIAGFYYEDVEMAIQNNGVFYHDFGGKFLTTFGAPNLFAFQTRAMPMPFSSDISATHSDIFENSSSMSAFFEGTWYVNDQLTLTAGVRVSEDEKDVLNSQVNSCSAAACGGIGIENATANPIVAFVHNALLGRLPVDFPLQERSENHTTPSLKATYELSDTTRLYASYADGYKAGGYDGSENPGRAGPTTPSDAFEFQPEEATTIELGIKMTNPENNLRFNAAYFSTEYTDMQVSAFNGSTFIVSNAAEADITGFEFDLTWAPADDLIVGASATSLNFEYGNFIAACTGDQLVAFAIANGTRAGAGCTQDLKGKAGNFAPELSAHLYANYFASIANKEVIFTMAANYRDDFNSSGIGDIRAQHDSATKIDANIKFMLTDDVELKIFGRNITDEIVGNSSLALPLVPGSHFKLWEPGKEVGLALRKKF